MAHQKVSDTAIVTALRMAKGKAGPAAQEVGLSFEYFMKRVASIPEARELLRRRVRQLDDRASASERFPDEYLQGIQAAVAQIPGSLTEEYLVSTFPELVRAARLGVLGKQHGAGSDIQGARREIERELRFTDDVLDLARWHLGLIREFAAKEAPKTPCRACGFKPE